MFLDIFVVKMYFRISIYDLEDYKHGILEQQLNRINLK